MPRIAEYNALSYKYKTGGVRAVPGTQNMPPENYDYIYIDGKKIPVQDWTNDSFLLWRILYRQHDTKRRNTIKCR